jgi:hypothetical protein
MFIFQANYKRGDSGQKVWNMVQIGLVKPMLSRIIKGWDPRILNSAFVKKRKTKGSQKLKGNNGLEYAINWVHAVARRC